MKRLILVLISLIFATPAAATNFTDLAEYYIGVDSGPVVTFGPYTGLPNPNQNRLTFLFSHVDHFHSIGRFDYIGPVEAPTVVPTNVNNRIPETFTGLPPLPLTPGSGPLYTGKLVSVADDAEYSDLEIRSVRSLKKAPDGSEADILFNSSNGRWTRSFHRAVVALQLVSRTQGLHIGTAEQAEVLEHPGDIVIVKNDNSNVIRFTPVYWVDGDAPSGTYSAELRLLDVNIKPHYQRLDSSGTFNFDFAVP